MTAPAVADGHQRSADVAVVGGGLAGLAAATHLVREGLDVVCLEPRPWPRPAVGESLEFSAAKLLGNLGIDTGRDRGPHLYPKTSVRIVGDRDEFEVWPPPWFARAPIWCSRTAFHTDRSALDAKLLEVATQRGVDLTAERVMQVERDRDLITGLVTDAGTRITARWYIDASGHNARVLARALGLDRKLLGPSRTGVWARVGEVPTGHATTLHFPESAGDELAWVWEIPLNDAETSVGAVLSTARVTRMRAEGLGLRDVFEHQIAPIDRLRSAAGAHPDLGLRTTTYSPFVHHRTAGPNWVLVGDVAAMVDPLTSNGVTSALRHAEAATHLVTGALGGRRRRVWAYHHSAPANIATLEQAMESFLYEPRVRQRFGLRAAVTLYAGTGVVTNSLYAKVDPSSLPRAAACAAVLAASRTWTRAARVLLARPGGRRRAGCGTGSATATGSSAATGSSPATGARGGAAHPRPVVGDSLAGAASPTSLGHGS